VGLVFILLLLSFSFGQENRQRAQPVRVLVITIDTLRADHLECYGYQKIKTPNVNRLARDGVLFEHAFSPVPLTLPAHCSIFTGTYPWFHGVRDQSGSSLATGSETLASKLKMQGLPTAAFVGSFVLDSRFGLSQGFDYYYDHFDSTRARRNAADPLERRAEVVAREAIHWMEGQQGNGFFAWLHFYDPHVPYAPPDPFKSRYSQNPYDGEIAYTDSVVGTVLDFLILRGWYEGALVVLASDHGEDLGDHGENTHGYFVYDSTVRVPLIIKLPHGSHAGRRVGPQVRLIDLMPTVLRVAGCSPGKDVQGRSLLSLLSSGTQRPAEDAYGETFYPFHHFGWSPLHYIRTAKFKYIVAPSPELYDLERDPGEKINLVAQRQALADQLRARLHAGYGRLQRVRPSQNQPVDLATQDALRSLGYLSQSSRTFRLSGDRNLSDPKQKLPLYTLFQSALLESQTNLPDAASQKLKAILAKDPGLTDAHIHLGLIYKRSGNYALAIEHFQQAIKSDHSNVLAVYNLAHSYALAGKSREAVLGFERTLALNPKEVRAHVGLGIAYQTEGNHERAVQEYLRALEIDPHDSTARNNLGSIYLHRREVEKAMTEFRRSLEINNESAETHNLIGSAYWLKNDAGAATSEFREAIRLDKSYLDAYLNLGMLLANQGQLRDALSYLEAATSLAPRSARAHELLAQTYQAAGRTAEAEKTYARVKELTKP
jgi:arylsulfatase A-like enzyme/Tfp pilus assembly protein PilF